MLQSFRIPRAALFNVLDGIHTQAAARTVPAEIKTAYIIMARFMAADRRKKETPYFTRKKNWRCRKAAFQKHRS